MFHCRQSKVVTRKKFEERTWKKTETFHEYFHEKIILSNRVPIDDDEILEYIVDGIPNESLRNQARIQRFTTIERLLESIREGDFEGAKCTRCIELNRSSISEVTTKSRASRKGLSTMARIRSLLLRRCVVITGERDHVSVNCPTKDQVFQMQRARTCCIEMFGKIKSRYRELRNIRGFAS